jgi:hypothetical protein
MRRILSLLALASALMLAACVQPTSGGGGSASSSATTLEIDGHPVTLADLVKSPLVRPAIYPLYPVRFAEGRGCQEGNQARPGGTR